MNNRMCMCCESCVDAESLDVIKITHNAKVVGIVCDKCQVTVKSFKLSFERTSGESDFIPLQFQCLKSFETDAYEARLVNAEQ